MFFERVVQAGRHTEWRRREREMEEREEREREREKMGEEGRWRRREGGREDVFVQSVDHKQDR